VQKRLPRRNAKLSISCLPYQMMNEPHSGYIGMSSMHEFVSVAVVIRPSKRN
jgi:hypothetical protein